MFSTKICLKKNLQKTETKKDGRKREEKFSSKGFQHLFKKII